METGHLITMNDSLKGFPFGMSMMMDLSMQMRYIINITKHKIHSHTQHSGWLS